MFDVGFSELLLIGVVALLVLGPERLPRAARVAGLWMRRARASWFSLRSELERELADDELRRSLKQGSEQLREVERDLREQALAMNSAFTTLPPTLEAAVDSAAADAPAASKSETPTADQHDDPAPLPAPAAGTESEPTEPARGR